MSTENLTDRLLPPATIAAMLAALYLVFVAVPSDAFQGPVQRIFYVHMAMWLNTFTAFAIVGVASLLYLWKRGRRWDHVGRAAAELGLLFCSLGLATGSIWAKPIWGTWWTWDPRLTLTTDPVDDLRRLPAAAQPRRRSRSRARLWRRSSACPASSIST